MHYILMCCFNETAWDKLPEVRKATIMRDYREWIQSLVHTGQFRGGAKLAPASLARNRHLTASACFGTDSKC